MESSTRLGCDPKVARRSFLQGSTALAAAAIWPTVFFAEVARAGGGAFARSYFEDRVGQFFSIDDGGWRSVELIGVVSSDISPLLDQFIVRFRGSPHVPIEEGLYTVAPPDGATFELHVQPAGADRDGCDYVAVFSLVKPIAFRWPLRRRRFRARSGRFQR